MKTSAMLAVLVTSVFATALAQAQSTSGSAGKGTTEPGASAAEASSFGNTGRSPSVTGSNDPAPKIPGAAQSNPAAPAADAATSFHGGGINAEVLFRKLDANGDGQLSREEFAKVQSILASRPTGGAPEKR